MQNYNHIGLQGFLTKDPMVTEISTEEGSERLKCKFILANNKTVKDVEKTTYVNCVAFGKLAEICKENLKKGYEVIVSGELTSYLRELSDGSTYNQISVLVTNISFGNNKMKDYKEIDRDDTCILLEKETKEEIEYDNGFGKF